MAVIVKQWQLGFAHPLGQLHSEQRWRHTVPVTQQNHSPPVEQPSGQPPPSWQGLQGNGGLRFVQNGPTPTHGLHGPPPQPTQPETEPSETPVRVRYRLAPSEPAVMNLKNCLREERRASVRAAVPAKSIATR
jgi:hypothetical protein